MADKFTHVYVGLPGYVHLLPSGPVTPAVGDKFKLTDDEASSVGEDFQPIGKHAEPTEAPAGDNPEES